jgi:hypothetical protein
MTQIAISIRQPWLFLITRPDVLGYAERTELYREKMIKDFENRTRDIGNPMKITGSPDVWLHASLTPAEQFDNLRLNILSAFGIQIPTLVELPRGGICGRATFEPFVDENASPWAHGSGYPIFSAMPCRFVECKGALGFFKLPAAIKLPAL